MRPSRMLCLFVFASSLAAQAQTYIAARVEFSDKGSFTQEQLEQAAGLHAGFKFTGNDLAAAAQRLVDTGYFDDVGASLGGKATAITVKFADKTTPKSRMIPIRFSNLVWLSPTEIESAVRVKMPLFIGYLPDASPHLEEVKEAVTKALAAKSIDAQVVFETFEPTLQHPIREINFHILNPAIRVANIKLSGVTPALAPLVQKSVNSTVHTLYTEGPADQTTVDRILAPLLDAGYAQASLKDVVPAPTVTSPDNINITLGATLAAGEVFQVASINFAGTPVLSAQSFAASARLHPGDLASHALLLATLASIDQAYRRKGYMDVIVNASPAFDTAAHTVTYAVDVRPGELYRIRELTANNLDPAAREDFTRGFLMKTGEIYNPDYVMEFLKDNTALRALDGYSAGFKAYANPNDHTVDLVITFVRGAR